MNWIRFQLNKIGRKLLHALAARQWGSQWYLLTTAILTVFVLTGEIWWGDQQRNEYDVNDTEQS